MDTTLKSLGDIKYISIKEEASPLFRLDLGEIRKITIGDVKNGFSFSVGTVVNVGGDEIKISKIVRDENSFFIFGSILYVIYVKNSNGEEKIWNYIENQPVRVECKL
jgi:hypothetical protein